GQHLPGQFAYPFGFPFPYAQQYDLTFANGLLGAAAAAQQSSPNSQQSPKQHKPSTNFSVASLLGRKDNDSDSKRRQSKDSSKRIARQHNSSYSEGEEEEDEDIDEELMEESAAAAAAAAAADDEDDEAVDMSASRSDDDRKISVTRLTPSPSPHQLSPPSSSRSASPLSPNYLESANGQSGKNMSQHIDSMSAALQLQLAAAAAARHRFTVDGLMNDSPAGGQGQQAPPHPAAMFGPHGPHPHMMHPGGAN